MDRMDVFPVELQKGERLLHFHLPWSLFLDIVIDYCFSNSFLLLLMTVINMVDVSWLLRFVLIFVSLYLLECKTEFCNYCNLTLLLYENCMNGVFSLLLPQSIFYSYHLFLYIFIVIYSPIYE